MTIDLDAISPAARAAQIKLGQSFSSRDTLSQANHTLTASAVHGPTLAAFGFTAGDIEQLAQARDMLIQASVEREVSRGHRKMSGHALGDALRRAREARLHARAILDNVRDVLEEMGAEAAQRSVEAALAQSLHALDSAAEMAAQLDLMHQCLTGAGVAEPASSRGGGEAAAALEQASAALRAADQGHLRRRGTPAETQRIDQLDGIVVRLVRRARRAAQAASRAQGDPALVRAFHLDLLYGRRRGGGADLPGDAAGDAAGAAAGGAMAVQGQLPEPDAPAAGEGAEAG
ncbi:hypothetical protein [Haliangium ochraceum]|uniref:Uncharacterized protein n=1 Tax=Haliangium ochraceum (strain DSM 14365 / JCM 11303 / SMP-2) TaxID=502025 RepID=D0LI45_HALO1|nr:hypothetical protein [Haliangium ochraceum]ACY16424.1 hypothetical protein Hoch_3925 [Haliangium ochraceum DSM 14365]